MRGKADAAFRTKPETALALVQQAVDQGIPFRAVVADSFYGEHRGFWPSAGSAYRAVIQLVIDEVTSRQHTRDCGEPTDAA